jgi:flagellar basal-body rod modification protein FlgD
MTVAATTATSGTSITSTAATTTPIQSYNSDLFLKLLVTQLQNQDPSSPMDSTQMVAQTSQLASMQQMTAMATSTADSYSLQQRTSAANVIGKTVSWTDSDGVAQSGVATAVAYSSTAGTAPTITVGTQTVSLDDLTGIADTSSTAGSTTTTS